MQSTPRQTSQYPRRQERDTGQIESHDGGADDPRSASLHCVFSVLPLAAPLGSSSSPLVIIIIIVIAGHDRVLENCSRSIGLRRSGRVSGPRRARGESPGPSESRLMAGTSADTGGIARGARIIVAHPSRREPVHFAPILDSSRGRRSPLNCRALAPAPVGAVVRQSRRSNAQ